MKARRRPVIDEYVQDGEAAVFVDGNVVVLSPLATHLLGLLDDRWSEVEPLAAGLLDMFGPPPDDPTGIDSTSEALRSLEELSVVEVSG